MFGDRLKDLRRQKGITQEQLAAAIGVERSSIGHYEGKSANTPSDDVKIKIAKFFNVSLDYLFGMPEDEINDENRYLLSEDEKKLIDTYRNMNEQGKQYIRQTMMMAAPIYIRHNNDSALEKID